MPSIFSFDQNAISLQPVRMYLKYVTHGTVFQEISVIEERVWGKTGTKPPPDKPVCGFYHELCPDDNSGNIFTDLL